VTFAKWNIGNLIYGSESRVSATSLIRAASMSASPSGENSTVLSAASRRTCCGVFPSLSAIAFAPSW